MKKEKVVGRVTALPSDPPKAAKAKPDVAVVDPASATGSAPGEAVVKEPTAPPKQFRCVGVDASTGKAVIEEVEEE